MYPLPFVCPYAVIFWLVFGLFYSQEMLVALRRKPKAGESRRQDRGSFHLVTVGLTICSFTAFYSATRVQAAGFHHGQVLWFWAGVTLMVAGTVLRQHCFIILGRYFRPVVSVVPEQPIIKRGAYRWIRHPSYLAGILIMLGIGLALGNWISLVALGLVPLVFFTYRIYVEEKALLETLGQSYRDYMTRTTRLIPFLF